MKKFQILIILLVLINPLLINIKAQNIDSLIQRVKQKDLPISERFNLYDEISWYYVNVDPDKAIEFAHLGLVLSKENKDKYFEAAFLRNKGVGYYMMDIYDTAEIYLESALEKATEMKNAQLTCKIYIAIANLKLQTSFYDKAIETYTKALKLSDSLGMKKESGKIYHNIGIAYQRMEIMDRALHHFEKSRIIALEIEDTHSIGFLNMAISNIYMDTLPSRALELANEALVIFREQDNLFGEVMSLLTIAQCYYKTENYTSSLEYANQSYEMAKNSNFMKLEIESLLVLSNIFFYQQKYELAESYASKALEIDSTTSHLVSNLLSNIIISNIYLGNKKKAVEYVINYGNHLNRFANENYQKALSEHEIKYETEKNQLKIESLEKEKKLFYAMLVLAVLLLIITIVFLINRQTLHKVKQKVMLEQLKRAENEKDLIAARASLAGEAAERSRLARDLHDGLGSMLSVVKFSIPNINNGSIIDNQDVEKFNKTIGLLDESINELRRIAHHMMPESLLRLGLKNSLADFCLTNNKIKFHYYGEDRRFETNLEILIYRTVHELVSNALKHADANEINVQLVIEKDRVSVTVQDDGKGFDIHQEFKNSMGLNNVKQRVLSFGGKIDIYSNNKGTEVHIEFNQNKNNDI